jgi:hypothetical protein
LLDCDGVLVLWAMATVAIGSKATTAGVRKDLENFMVSPLESWKVTGLHEGSKPHANANAALIAGIIGTLREQGAGSISRLEISAAGGANDLTTWPGVSEDLVGRVGLEPTTNALKGRCSTN